MAKGFKHGTSGKKPENPFNFEVKTYPSETELKADTPAENTIGVIQLATMTKWAFSPTEPTEPEVGMVWISVGNSGDASFNALKENEIKLYPMAAKQYVSSEWKDVTAMSYQGGEWVDWITPLYSAGNKMVDFTEEYDGNGANTTTWGESGVTIYIVTTTNKGTASGWIYTDIVQGTANGKNLVVKYKDFSGTYGTSSYLVAGVSSDSNPALDTNGNISSSIALNKVSTPSSASSGTLTVDLSNVTTDGRVIVGISNNSSNYPVKSTTVTITDIYIA